MSGKRKRDKDDQSYVASKRTKENTEDPNSKGAITAEVIKALLSGGFSEDVNGEPEQFLVWSSGDIGNDSECT